jgi:hypothetical protein
MRTASIKRILPVTFSTTNGWDHGVNTDETLSPPPPRTALECLANIAAPAITGSCERAAYEIRGEVQSIDHVIRYGPRLADLASDFKPGSIRSVRYLP